MAYTALRMGLATGLVLLVIGCGEDGDFFNSRGQFFGNQPTSLDQPDQQNYWLPGLLLATVSGLNWIIGSIRDRFWLGSLLRVLAVAVGGWLLSIGSTNPFIAHFARAGAIVWVQCVLFHLIGFPAWPGNVKPAQPSGFSLRLAGYQFGVGELLVTITSAACLFAIMKVYVGPGNSEATWLVNFVRYWAVDALIWLTLPMIAWGVYQVSTRFLVRTLRGVCGVGAIILAGVLAIVLVYADFSYQSGAAIQLGADVLSKYARVMAGFLMGVHAFALAACLLPQSLQSVPPVSD